MTWKAESSFIVRSGLPHRNDVTESPLARGLVAEAEEIGDLRVVRFFLKIWPTEMFFGVKCKKMIKRNVDY